MRMRNTLVCLYLLALSLCGSLAANGQGKTAAVTRHPVLASPGFFASLNSKPKHMAINKLSASSNAATQQQSPRIVSLPNFTRSFAFGGQVYPYTMVGQHPRKNQPTLVPTQYVPMSFYFDEFVDQNGNNITIDTTAISNEIAKSPLFEPSQFADGFTQFEDAQMRAEFFPSF